MWTCPKCGREFKRTNQGHYCGKAPETIEEYIEAQIPEARAHIRGLRDIIRRCVPEINERIAWSMPFFEKGMHSISYAACKKHISLYLNAEILEIIRPQMDGFAIKKNAAYLPYDKALPEEIIERAVKLYFENK